MFRSSLLTLTLLAGAALAAPPRLVVPAEVRPAGDYALMTPDTDAVSVTFIGLSNVDPFPSSELKDARKFLLPVRGLAQGRYRFAAVGAGKDGEQSRADFTVVVGDAPPVPPGPGPGPEPGPTPGPAPIPAEGFRVLVVYESADLPKYPAAQQAAIYSKAVRDYLNAKCAVGPDGKTREWRMYDADIATDGESKLWQEAMKRPRKSTPWVIISTGKGGYEGPLPASAEEMLNLLKKWGGA